MSPPDTIAVFLPQVCSRRSTMTERKRNSKAWYVLLVVPFVGTLWVPFYNGLEPRLGGVPYFYWYQFGWIGIGAAITALVYFATREPDA